MEWDRGSVSEPEGFESIDTCEMVFGKSVQLLSYLLGYVSGEGDESQTFTTGASSSVEVGIVDENVTSVTNPITVLAGHTIVATSDFGSDDGAENNFIQYRNLRLMSSIQQPALNPLRLPCLASAHWICSVTADDDVGKQRPPPEVQEAQHYMTEYGRSFGRPFFVWSVVLKGSSAPPYRPGGASVPTDRLGATMPGIVWFRRCRKQTSPSH